MAVRDLTLRWHEPGATQLRLDARRWLLGQGPRPDGLESINGRVDLRGLPLSWTATVVGSPEPGHSAISWDSLDLRNAQLDHLRFFGVRMQNCLFDGASCLNWALWGVHGTDNSFVRASLKQSGLGTGDWSGPRTHWLRTDFSRARLNGSFFAAASLRSCRFRDATSVQFLDCEVVECEFAGKLRHLIINGRGLAWSAVPRAISVDFSGASWDDCIVEAYDLSSMVPPAQGDVLVVHDYASVLRRAVTLVGDELSETSRRARKILERMVNAAGPSGTDLALDVTAFGPDLAPLINSAITRASQLD